ncbi:hypothetical protein FOZ60_000011 [Perkinsus olseni]|uniref:Heparan-alpha-glucosaminide N-acetyltransferase catalytic domain-containing protein n=1 Tax=Perkinsus olseni TaxID=32597 RepID=A0A7J6PND1_PEROL|nr:hypothetical protein FOZ60_000011 [Perkinsus olseni]
MSTPTNSLSSDLGVLMIAGCTMTASLSLVHWLSIDERARFKRAWTDYEQVRIPARDGMEEEMSVLGEEDSKRRRGPKPRAPFIDFLRGLSLAFIVSFHFMWDLREFHFLPHAPPLDKAGGLPIRNYLFFIVYFAISFTSFILACLYSPYLGYAVYAPVVTYCIYSMWWESQVSGVCLIMICLGMSQALWVYFGAVHCLCLNSLLTVPFARRPQAALLGFLFIQSYTMAFGACPLEVPLDWPTLDVMPWFHNFGYCLLGVWLYSKGLHKLASISGIPGTRVYLEDTVLTTFGRHSLIIYLLHQGLLFPIVYGVSLL